MNEIIIIFSTHTLIFALNTPDCYDDDGEGVAMKDESNECQLNSLGRAEGTLFVCTYQSNLVEQFLQLKFDKYVQRRSSSCSMRRARGARAVDHKCSLCIVDDFSMAGGMIGSSIINAIDGYATTAIVPSSKLCCLGLIS